VEERDGRSKRSSGRDRRSGVVDDGKEKDDRKDCDRDREREKEPAWMETYTPVDSAPGILGGKGGEDELDGIQAFKKDMKAKEQKDMPSSMEKSRAADADRPSGSSKAENTSTAPLDEIQLFRLMMKKEQQQKVPNELNVPTSEPISTGPILHELGNGAPPRIKDQREISNGTSCPLSVCYVTDYI
jgi:zinc finger CCCH domain-containing protein 13